MSLLPVYCGEEFSLSQAATPMLDKTSYIHAFNAETSALTEAARLGVDAMIPSCPGWTVAALLGHLGGIYVMVAKNISMGGGEDVVNELADLELEPAYERWFSEGRATAPPPPSVVDWFAESVRRLENVFRQTDEGERTWTWWPEDQTAGFWMRRMAQEPAVHRRDATLAHRRTEPIPVSY